MLLATDLEYVVFKITMRRVILSVILLLITDQGSNVQSWLQISQFLHSLLFNFIRLGQTTMRRVVRRRLAASYTESKHFQWRRSGLIELGLPEPSFHQNKMKETTLPSSSFAYILPFLYPTFAARRASIYFSFHVQSIFEFNAESLKALCQARVRCCRPRNFARRRC